MKATVMVISLNFPLARKISKKEVEKTARKRRVSPHVLCPQGESRGTSDQEAARCPTKEAVAKSPAPKVPAG